MADPGQRDLLKVPREDDRCLLLLSKFLKAFPKEPLNIEMKGSFKEIPKGDKEVLRANLSEFLKILNDGRGDRVIVVVSAKHSIIKEFRRQKQRGVSDKPFRGGATLSSIVKQQAE